MTATGKKFGLCPLAAMRHRHSGSVHSALGIIARGLRVGLLAASLTAHDAAAADAQWSKLNRPLFAYEGTAPPSTDERQPVVAHLHPVIASKFEERRLERLATPTPRDNRISHGCINVPGKFFDNVVRPALARTNGTVCVLPETRSAQEVFAAHDVDEHARLQCTSEAVPALVAVLRNDGSDPRFELQLN